MQIIFTSQGVQCDTIGAIVALTCCMLLGQYLGFLAFDLFETYKAKNKKNNE